MHEMDAVMATTLPLHAHIVDRRGKKQTSTLANLFLVNGQHRPTVTVDVGQATVLRLGYAAGSCFVNISLPRACEFHVMAYDGVPMQRSEAVKGHWLYLTTATRIDVAMLCHTAGLFSVKLLNDVNHTLFYLHVRPTDAPAKTKSTSAKEARSHTNVFPLHLNPPAVRYLSLKSESHFSHDISLSQRDTANVKPRPFYVLGQGRDCSTLASSSTCRYEHFSGAKGNLMSSYDGFAVEEGSVVTARLFGDPTDPMNHPFHFHVNHFRVLSFVPREGGQHANHTLEMYGVHPNQYRDTIPVLDGVTTVQWRASTYTGEIVYHCHNLAHEDNGMMTSYLVYNTSETKTPGGAYDDSRTQMDAHESRASSDASGTTAAPIQNKIAYLVLLSLFIVSFAIAAVYHGIQLFNETDENDEAGELTGTPNHNRAIQLTEHSPLLPSAREIRRL